MILKIEENTTVFDFVMMIEGSLDNIFEVMSKYNIVSIDEDLKNREFDVIFNTNSNIVSHLYLKKMRIKTGDLKLFSELNNYKGEFNSDFNNDFNNI